ncbi:MAG: hypothetical protein QF464_16045, partial [Myxococcota bacterium]|nr:hypothetical protein [Myxococcota bacterium]
MIFSHDGDPTFAAHLTQLSSDDAASPVRTLQCLDDLVKQMVVYRLHAEHGLTDWETVDLMRMSLSQAKRALRGCGEDTLAEQVSSYRDLRNQDKPECERGGPDIVARSTLAAAILDTVGCHSVPVRPRSPQVRREVNAVSIETLHGYRTFFLEHGDLLETATDLVVYSAGFQDNALAGHFVRQARQMYQVESPIRPFLHINEFCLAALQEGNERTPYAQSLVIKTPKLRETDEPHEAYEEV